MEYLRAVKSERGHREQAYSHQLPNDQEEMEQATEPNEGSQSTLEPDYGQGLDTPIFQENAVKNLAKD